MPTRVTTPILLAVAVALTGAAAARPASADLAKLNATARITMQQLQGGLAQPSKRPGAEGLAELDVFIVGDATRAQLEAAGARVRTVTPRVCTASVPLAALDAVTALPGVLRIDGAVRLQPELDVSVPATGADLLRGAPPDFPGLNGQGVLIGDVDTGIDYHHDDFKDAQGHTRLVGIWDQTDAAGPLPPHFGYGTEWSPADIDAGTARARDFDGHGTHVLGIAGGDGSGTGGTVAPFTYVGMAPRASLAMVKTDFTDTGVLDGVAWVFGKATELGLNAVCNLSLGTQYGPHDGTSAIEMGLSDLAGPGRIVCVSAGNERGFSDHAQVTATPAGTAATLYVQHGFLGATCAMAAYYDARDTIDILIGPPSPDPVGPLSSGASTLPYPGNLTFSGYVYAENGLTTYPSGMREIYMVLTEASRTSLNGNWILKFIAHGLGPAHGRVDLWRFDSSVPSLFVAGADPSEMLVSEPGNADGVITVGAWNTKHDWYDCEGVYNDFGPFVGANGALSSFSSPGPTRDGRPKPDLVAPGAEIASATSFDTNPVCAPAYSYLLPDGMMHRIDQGTSMASPHLAGACALLLQRFGPLDPAAVKSYLFAHALVDGTTGAVWNRDWGHGKLQMGDLVGPTTQVVSPNGGEILGVGESPLLQWNASDPSGIASVDVLLSRTGPGGPFTSLAAGLPNTGKYAWTVTGPSTQDAYLRVVAHDGVANASADTSDAAFVIAQDVDAGPPGAPRAFALAPPAPNPVGGAPLRVEFALPRAAEVRLRVLDIRGRVVATLAHGRYAPGVHAVSWDHAGPIGRVGAGLYFVHYVTPDGSYTRRVIVTD